MYMALSDDTPEGRGINECLNTYYSDNKFPIMNAIQSILEMEPNSERTCCQYWRFMECLLRYSCKVCTQEENAEWILFTMQVTQYQEMTKCKDTHRDSPKCISNHTSDYLCQQIYKL